MVLLPELTQVLELFLSTLPARGATRFHRSSSLGPVVISIHAPREGSDVYRGSCLTVRAISIHAPREGSDVVVVFKLVHLVISIHAPREGSDNKRQSTGNN